MIPKEECEELLNALLPFAVNQLKKYGEFYPFGAVMYNNNETANMKDLENVNQKLSFLTDKVEQIENMQLLSKSVENIFSKNQITATRRIAWISILQIAIIFGIGCYNVYAIREAFKNKAEMPFWFKKLTKYFLIKNFYSINIYRF